MAQDAEVHRGGNWRRAAEEADEASSEPRGRETGPTPCGLTYGNHQAGDGEQPQADFESRFSKWQHAGFGILQSHISSP